MAVGSDFKKMSKMSHVHRADCFRRRSFFQQGVDSFLMKPWFEEVLKLREDLVNVRSQLDFEPSTLFDSLLTKAAKGFEVHQVDVPQGHVTSILHEQEGSCDQNGVDLVRLGFADVVLPQACSLYRIDDTDLVIVGNKVLDQVVAVVSRRFKTDDEPVFAERIQLRGQEPEAITVVCELERLDEYFAIRWNGWGKVVKFGDVDANINHEDVPPLQVFWHCDIRRPISS